MCCSNGIGTQGCFFAPQAPMRGAVRVHGGLLLLEEGGPINGRYRFAPDHPGAVWNGLFSDVNPKPVSVSTSRGQQQKRSVVPGPASGGINKRSVDSDYYKKKSKRRQPPTEEELAKRRAAARKAAATRARNLKARQEAALAPRRRPAPPKMHSFTSGRKVFPKHQAKTAMKHFTSGRKV